MGCDIDTALTGPAMHALGLRGRGGSGSPTSFVHHLRSNNGVLGRQKWSGGRTRAHTRKHNPGHTSRQQQPATAHQPPCVRSGMSTTGPQSLPRCQRKPVLHRGLGRMAVPGGERSHPGAVGASDLRRGARGADTVSPDAVKLRLSPPAVDMAIAVMLASKSTSLRPPRRSRASSRRTRSRRLRWVLRPVAPDTDRPMAWPGCVAAVARCCTAKLAKGCLFRPGGPPDALP
jgi:hypothetical protein